LSYFDQIWSASTNFHVKCHENTSGRSSRPNIFGRAEGRVEVTELKGALPSFIIIIIIIIIIIYLFLLQMGLYPVAAVLQ
jgi:hypothetical protein